MDIHPRNFRCSKAKILLILLLIFTFTACSDPDPTDPTETPVAIEPASAEAGATQLQDVGNTVQLDANESTGTAITYHWTFRTIPVGSVAHLDNFETVNPTFVIDQPGSYVAQLIVMNESSAVSKDFTVINTPNATLAFSANKSLIDHTGFNLKCQECHDGVTATGRPANHIDSTDECVVCHSAAAWSPNITVDHNELFGVCSNCHNGVRALGRSALHTETTAECNQCHVPGTSFTVALFPNMFTIAEDEDDEVSVDSDHPEIGNMMCVDCHNNVIEEGKPGDHILTTDACEACHTTNDWERRVTVDHTQVVGICSSCHDNVIARGKPPGHIDTTLECNSCHSTTSWTPTSSGGGSGGATVDHSGFTQATVCMDCHNGATAIGKPAGHVVTTSDCDVCHNTISFAGSLTGAVDHSTFTQATVCMSCHDGTTATGKSAGHIITSSDCDVCHTTTTFVGVASGAVDHSAFTQLTVCMTCHNGTTATGKPAGHIVTSSDCDICHVTATFSAVNLSRVDHSGFTLATVCMDCHNGTIAEGKPLDHIVTLEDCDACHNMRNFD